MILKFQIYIVLIVNIFSIALAWIGYNGNAKFNKHITALYAVVSTLSINLQITSSLFGMLLVYQVIDYLFSRHYVNSNDTIFNKETEAPSEAYVLFMLSIPYLVDFVSGLLSLKLSLYVFSLKNIDISWKYDVIFLYSSLKELYVVKTNTGQVLSHENQFILQKQIEKNKLCIICESNEINTVFYKCGHKLACLKCFQKLKKRKQLNCPICRSVIVDCIQQFEV